MPGAQNFTKSSETPKADEEYMGGQTLGAKIQGREGKSPDRPLRSQSVVWVNKEVFVHWHSGDGLGSSRSMMIAYQRTEGAQRRRKYSGLKTTTDMFNVFISGNQRFIVFYLAFAFRGGIRPLLKRPGHPPGASFILSTITRIRTLSWFICLSSLKTWTFESCVSLQSHFWLTFP